MELKVCTDHELIGCEDCTESGGAFDTIPVIESDEQPAVRVLGIELVPSTVLEGMFNVVAGFCTAMDAAIRMESWPAMKLIRVTMFQWIAGEEYPKLAGDEIWSEFTALTPEQQLEQVQGMLGTILGQ